MRRQAFSNVFFHCHFSCCFFHCQSFWLCGAEQMLYMYNAAAGMLYNAGAVQCMVVCMQPNSSLSLLLSLSLSLSLSLNVWWYACSLIRSKRVRVCMCSCFCLCVCVYVCMCTCVLLDLRACGGSHSQELNPKPEPDTLNT